MKYKHSTRQLEEGFKQEVRLLRQKHPDISFYDCRMQVLDSWEEEVILTDLDKEWIKKKRIHLANEKLKRMSVRPGEINDIDDLLDSLNENK